jgi:RNA polymerase sigma-70 factor (ECF subfamily)
LNLHEGDPMPAGSDTQLQGLIDLANRGDLKAKDLLLEHACDRLLKLTRKMFRNYPGLRRHEATDDVFTKSLMRLSRALEAVQVESVRHFFNLAGLQIRRELLDLKKHYFGPQGHATNHHTDHQPSDEMGGALHGTAEEPEDLDMWAEFHEAVETLPGELQEVFSLIYYDGLTQEDTAQLLDCSLSTVKRRWQEARIRLHDALRDSTQ